MEMEQELEWLEAQKIAIGVDLLAAARQQLQFLSAVDQNRCLYEGPALAKAIYRYNACWLPLLANHTESPIFEGHLVVPLDCEWIWHCHRLNPVRYKSDCEELYGKILDNCNVVSSVKGICSRKTEEIWNALYPDEPYSFDLTQTIPAATKEKFSPIEKCTKYDLVSAVKRQSPFFYQVSRPHMNNDIFLQEAVARYKGFLYLIKRNKERSIRRFCVPTYDIDLIWHTHQLHPISYCKDLTKALGKVLEHDDMDADRTAGKKLDVGFTGTTKQWEETFGTRYWKAGAMYRGSAPSPVTSNPFPSSMCKQAVAANEYQNMIQLPDLKIVEVILEIVGVKNLPEGHKGSLFVTFSKKQPDVFFTDRRKLTILSESGEKQIASFHCEPKGELIFELKSHLPSNLPVTKAIKTLGTTSLSLQDFLNPLSKFATEKWVELLSTSGNVNSKPICLRIALSFTLPAQAPYVLQMVHSRPLSKGSCFFPLLGRQANSWTRISSTTGDEMISLQMRDSTKSKTNKKSILNKQVIGVTKSGETHILAESVGPQWSLMDSQWCLQLKKKPNDDGPLFELVGSRMVKFFQGRKLDFEPMHWEKQRREQYFMTAVDFSAECPYGKAVALLDLKSGVVKVKKEWLVLPGIISTFILSDILERTGNDGLIEENKYLEMNCMQEKVNGFHEEPKQTSLPPSAESKVELTADGTKGNAVKGGGCGTGCGNMVKSGGCGSGCGSGCGGGGCGNMVKSGGCGGGCGGGCRSGCGGCGGGGCGNMLKSGGCGGCSAGGCFSSGADSGGSIEAKNDCSVPCTEEFPKELLMNSTQSVVA